MKNYSHYQAVLTSLNNPDLQWKGRGGGKNVIDDKIMNGKEDGFMHSRILVC